MRFYLGPAWHLASGIPWLRNISCMGRARNELAAFLRVRRRACISLPRIARARELFSSRV